MIGSVMLIESVINCLISGPAVLKPFRKLLISRDAAPRVALATSGWAFMYSSIAFCIARVELSRPGAATLPDVIESAVSFQERSTRSVAPVEQRLVFE